MSEPEDEFENQDLEEESSLSDESGISDESKGSGVADMVRRALLAGVGAVFMTEEGIRKSVAELKLPKEAIGYIAGHAEKTRTEAGRVFRKELRRFLNSEAFKDQLTQLVSGLTLEIKAEVRLKPAAEDDGDSLRIRVKPGARPPEK